QVRLRDLIGPEPLGRSEDVEGAVVAERWTDPRVQPLHGLQVVGEDVWLGLDDRGDVALSTLEVGRQDLDPAARNRSPDRADARGPDGGAAVRQVVPSDTGDHHVP